MLLFSLLSRGPLFVTPWTTACKLLSTALFPGVCSNSCPLNLVTLSNHLILYSSLPHCLQFFPASGSFSSESALHIRWPKYWGFSFSISPSNEYSGLICFRLDFLTVQGTLQSFLLHHNSKVSILWCSATFMVQFSYPYVSGYRQHLSQKCRTSMTKHSNRPQKSEQRE